jgi:hypothetical protein
VPIGRAGDFAEHSVASWEGLRVGRGWFDVVVRIVRRHGGNRDLLGGRDEGPVQEATGHFMGDQERLDPAPQLVVGRAFTVKEGDAMSARTYFEGRQEDGLHAARVERH